MTTACYRKRVHALRRGTYNEYLSTSQYRSPHRRIPSAWRRRYPAPRGLRPPTVPTTSYTTSS
eukprot:8634569-Pyramimonas_sp.AAC.1